MSYELIARNGKIFRARLGDLHEIESMTGLEFKDYVTKPVALKMADRIACQMEKRLRFIEKINHLHSCPFSHIRDFKMALDIIDGFVDIHHLVNDIKYYNDFIKFVRENGGFKVE